jgi:hypothetical protein
MRMIAHAKLIEANDIIRTAELRVLGLKPELNLKMAN